MRAGDEAVMASQAFRRLQLGRPSSRAVSQGGAAARLHP